MNTKQYSRTSPHPESRIPHPRAAFTLIELLVVITIIGILVALLTVAAVAALRTARQTEIKAEVNQMDEALVEYKNKTTAFPPNAQTDFGPDEPVTPAQRQQVFNDFKRHLKQAFPRNQEPDNLIRVLCGIQPQNPNASNFPKILEGGMSAGESLVFWLGGFSADPRYPISGEGGPSYRIDNLTSGIDPFEADPIENRSWVFPFDVGRLAPRTDDGYFDQTDERFIEYTVGIKGVNQRRRINFWQYAPRNSQEPYLYFDTSRYTPDQIDPPARADVHVHALKKIENAGSPNERPVFVESETFQILHCGIDEAWGEEFDRVSYAQWADDPSQFLSFPDGPFIGDIADTIVNFTTETKLEDAAP